MLKPIYAKNIIVAVIKDKKFTWYITDKEDEHWYMDYYKRIERFRKSGCEINISDDDHRKEIVMLDTDTIDILKKRISKYEVDTKVIRKHLENEMKINEEWHFDLSPSLYFDFDNKIMYSCYREMDIFEDYVPKDWIGDFKDFTYLVPIENSYWIGENGIDYLYVFYNGGD